MYRCPYMLCKIELQTQVLVHLFTQEVLFQSKNMLEDRLNKLEEKWHGMRCTNTLIKEEKIKHGWIPNQVIIMKNLRNKRQSIVSVKAQQEIQMMVIEMMR